MKYTSVPLQSTCTFERDCLPMTYNIEIKFLKKNHSHNNTDRGWWLLLADRVARRPSPSGTLVYIIIYCFQYSKPTQNRSGMQSDVVTTSPAVRRLYGYPNAINCFYESTGICIILLLKGRTRLNTRSSNNNNNGQCIFKTRTFRTFLPAYIHATLPYRFCNRLQNIIVIGR